MNIVGGIWSNRGRKGGCVYVSLLEFGHILARCYVRIYACVCIDIYILLYNISVLYIYVLLYECHISCPIRQKNLFFSIDKALRMILPFTLSVYMYYYRIEGDKIEIYLNKILHLLFGTQFKNVLFSGLIVVPVQTNTCTCQRFATANIQYFRGFCLYVYTCRRESCIHVHRKCMQGGG